MIRARRSFLVAGSSVLVAALVFALNFTGSNPVVARAQSDAVASDGIAVARQLSAVFEHVAETAQPFVVSVVSTGRVATAEMQSPFGERFPFEDFFGRDFFDRLRPPSGGEAPLRRGQGSGVIVSDDGYILTNHHVVAGAEAVTVRLFDDREFEAEIVGIDPKTDLTVLRIDARSLTPARLGNSDELKVGEWVVAAGNPFGLTASVTAGIVSALGRSNMAQHIMQSLIETGHVVHGWLGVGIQRLDPELARSFGYEGESGVVVTRVEPMSAAARAGIRRGDVIQDVQGHPVASIADFREGLREKGERGNVRLAILRGGMRVYVVLNAMAG